MTTSRSEQLLAEMAQIEERLAVIRHRNRKSDKQSHLLHTEESNLLLCRLHNIHINLNQERQKR